MHTRRASEYGQNGTINETCLSGTVLTRYLQYKCKVVLCYEDPQDVEVTFQALATLKLEAGEWSAWHSAAVFHGNFLHQVDRRLGRARNQSGHEDPIPLRNRTPIMQSAASHLTHLASQKFRNCKFWIVIHMPTVSRKERRLLKLLQSIGWKLRCQESFPMCGQC
jgi:hypothetical protein